MMKRRAKEWKKARVDNNLISENKIADLISLCEGIRALASKYDDLSRVIQQTLRSVNSSEAANIVDDCTKRRKELYSIYTDLSTQVLRLKQINNG